MFSDGNFVLNGLKSESNSIKLFLKHFLKT